MRLAGTAKQYSISAMPQLARMTSHSGRSVNLRWPYQANVMKTFEATRRSGGRRVRVIGSGTGSRTSGLRSALGQRKTPRFVPRRPFAKSPERRAAGLGRFPVAAQLDQHDFGRDAEAHRQLGQSQTARDDEMAPVLDDVPIGVAVAEGVGRDRRPAEEAHLPAVGVARKGE